MRTFLLGGAALCAALSLTACGSDDDDDGGDSGMTGTRTLSMSFVGLEDLGADQVYEGWLMVDGAPVSSGRFAIDAAGDPVPATFAIDAATAEAATAFILTLEPAVGDDPAPSDVHILAGDFSADSAALTTDHPAAIGTDFASAAGTFFLATPTSMATDDEEQGIWYIDTSSGGPAAGLSLPTLPAGWAYEGWVVVGGSPISTGTFTDAAMADSDGAGSTAGPEAAPPFPGQDFVSPATSLPGGMAVISVEPDPDNSAAPFAIKPLVAPIAAGTAPQTLNQNLGSVPTGTVSWDPIGPTGAG